jgi:hypothetical protein
VTDPRRSPAPSKVELIESIPLLVRGDRELIRLDRQTVRVEHGLAETAWHELLSEGEDDPSGDFRTGYLLGVESPRRGQRHPAASQLKAELYDQVVAPIAQRHRANFEFSFFKAAEGQPPSAAEGVHYGGYHVDTHAGDHSGLELLRVLLNVHSHLRRFRFAAVDRFELARRGAGIGRGVYQVPQLPGFVEDRELAIPAFDGQTISYITFWASVVPHVGVETAAGYFLASYEAAVPAGAATS